MGSGRLAHEDVSHLFSTHFFMVLPVREIISVQVRMLPTDLSGSRL